MNTTLGKDGMI